MGVSESETAARDEDRNGERNGELTEQACLRCLPSKKQRDQDGK